MRWLVKWFRSLRHRKCQTIRPEFEVPQDRQDAADARRAAELALADARRQGPEVSAVAGRLRRARVDDFAQLMTDAMRGT